MTKLSMPSDRRGASISSPDRRRLLAVTSVVLLAVIGGCANELASVSGQVTLDGQPLPSGANGGVVFHPPSGSPSYGVVNGEGKYRVKTGSTSGLRPGHYQVTLTLLSPLPPRLPDGTQKPGQVLSAPALNELGNGAMEIDVRRGANVVNVDAKNGIVR
jgi:hypothetical protein